MRNMLQLVGGIAVAGAVAAGSSAFTGAGLEYEAADPTNTFIGGTVHHTVSGATLTNIAFTANTNVSPTQVSAFILTLTGANGATVTATDAGATGVGGATKWSCTAVSAGTSTCTASDNSNVAAGYFTGVSDLTIKVV